MIFVSNFYPPTFYAKVAFGRMSASSFCMLTVFGKAFDKCQIIEADNVRV